MKKSPNFLYKLLVTSFTMSCFSEGVLLPIYAVFVQKIGGDILDAGFAMGVFLITQGVFTMIVHRFKWSPKQRMVLMVGGWAVWLFGIITYLWISSVLTLFLSQILTAIGNAIADPIFDEELADHTDKALEQEEWGFFEGSKDFVNGIAAIVGASIVGIFGFTSLIYVMIATASASMLLILVYIRRLRSIDAKTSPFINEKAF